MNKIKFEDAKRILSDVNPENCFWFNNGPVAKNICEFAEDIKSISDETFSHHLNNEKNDFSNWVRDIIRDEKLANDLKKLKSKSSILKKIKERIKQLEKIK